MYEAYALSGALNEVTLVLFTTLAPSGALAFVLMSLPIIFDRHSLDIEMRRGIDKYLSVPILVATVGLVASTTHLGNPSNALYVLAGIGRSPLSNEVLCGVLFLGAGGIYWLTSFSPKPRNSLFRRIFLIAVSILGLLFIGSISLAYNAETIITWSNPLVIAALWLNAFVGAPLLALFGFRLSRFYTSGHRLGKVLLFISSIALLANIAIYVMWGLQLPSEINSMASAHELAPMFFPMLIAFTALCAFGIALGIKAVKNKGEASIWVLVCAVCLVLAGIFVMRFVFYMIHMTVGVGI